MSSLFSKSAAPLLCAALAVPAWASLSAQPQPQPQPLPADASSITVTGSVPADLTGLVEGPEIDGLISARSGEHMQVLGADGSRTTILVSEATDIKARGGFLGLSRTRLAQDALLNGLPVSVQTVQWEDGLVASQIRLKNDDLETASMIHSGTEQRFGEHSTAIAHNAAATEALRGRVGDIDQYNVKATTNVYFDTNKATLTPAAENELCSTAAQAEQMDNALLLVVGYTDATGSDDYNQVLSERRAGRVVNHLQQKCGWAPYRMLTPTGMSESNPVADNQTPAGKAQNRRVAVNILVSKAVEGL